MKMHLHWFLLSFSLLPFLGIAMPDDPQNHAETFQFSSKENQSLALKLAKELRCPQCQNQNLIESNSPVAMHLRLKVYQFVEQGANEEQVIKHMTQRFGDMVHYKPPFKPGTAFLWLAPLLILGGLIGTVLMKKPTDDSKP
ncbi:cytochrome c-type biogenesis protein CcmH [Enterovibrio nigricans]|uniref:Cytochrome c-type biogenesis protein n=1 Tax=Enterovibrio nigricans DSM 22720 TaxID=1121868 RepID=A0A1T4VZ88_9GAMM|nr:cytochrome c-type biogenesis protein CcmH [Enterovibrio nigricans]SKA70330.1 Cytochrome c-type biogenesis protein CcmH/NrfF [Enterovibrio nigricans DSM 22720]